MIQIKDALRFLDGRQIKYVFKGNENIEILGFSSLSNYKDKTLTWIKDEQCIVESMSTISLLIAPTGLITESPNTISCNNPKMIFYKLIEHFFNKKRELAPIGHNTYISDSVIIGDNVRIGHNCSIDGNITIGDNTIIYNNVSIINKVKIGRNCVIQSGVLIGDEGYSYVEDENHVKTMNRQYGGVTIGDDVLIGAGTIIQNGAIDDTTIERGCKISAHTFISHNAHIEENSAVIVSVMHGSSKAGRNTYIASGTIRNQVRVGDNAFVGLGSVVTKNVECNDTVVGVPAKSFKKE